MPRTAFTAWYDEVLPEINGAPPQALVLNAIRNAAIEFCEKSLIWNHEHDPVTIAANVNLYDYAKPASTVVVRPLQAWISKLTPVVYKTPGQLADLFGDWREAAGGPSFITQVRPAQFYLVPKPTLTIINGLTLRIAVKPSRAATDIETFIYEDWLDGITAGAKARLFAMNKKPWANAQLAADNLDRFTAKVREAQDRALRGYGPARHRVKPMYF